MSETSPDRVKVLFGSGSPALNEAIAALFLKHRPELPLVVYSEFQTSQGEWIPYHIHRSRDENVELLSSKLAGRTIGLGAIVLQPEIPHERLRALGRSLCAGRCLVFDETGHSFSLDSGGLAGRMRHRARLLRQRVASAVAPKSRLRRSIAGLSDWKQIELPLLYRRAVARGRFLARNRPKQGPVEVKLAGRPNGVSVVIPSRNGRELLAPCLPLLLSEQTPCPVEVIVVDNGSDDGTAGWLAGTYPDIVIELSVEPLAFAVGVNRGIQRARYSHVCVLNNDMQVEPGFLAALRAPFDDIADLFCTSAQIFLPEGQRREETGKTVWNPAPEPLEFPVRCDEPLDGEDQTYVLYGSGGCSLYDAGKLMALGGFDEVYTPAYVEDLDLGVRGWLQGWASVYCAGARVLHQHRATTSRYYTEQQLDVTLEVNFARFLARTIGDPDAFLRFWNRNVLRLKALEKSEALKASASLPAFEVPIGSLDFLDLTNGETCVFPGRGRTGKPVVVIASPYLPFPLSHGAAVRIFNLMRESADEFDLVLVAFVEQPAPVPRELLEICAEVVTVLRKGTHAPASQGRPDTVEEFERAAYRAILMQTIAKWRPKVVQLEFTQMAAYAADCGTAKTILVEHDITYDLYGQMLANPATNDWETQRQHRLWLDYETAAWKRVDCVVTMSEKDRAVVEGSRAVAIPNGVDLIRFTPSEEAPEARRLLFIGSFAHRPNVLALEWFLAEVFPKLRGVTLHVIAGNHHQRFWDLQHAGAEVEGFVADVRPAYRKAAVVIAPLVASAGTNIKILEAMAMGKAIVSTPAGIHGLDLKDGRDLRVIESADEMAAVIEELLASPENRLGLERQARATAEQVYGWDAIAEEQKKLYWELGAI